VAHGAKPVYHLPDDYEEGDGAPLVDEPWNPVTHPWAAPLWPDDEPPF
jgi:hypothetical protein